MSCVRCCFVLRETRAYTKVTCAYLPSDRRLTSCRIVAQLDQPRQPTCPRYCSNFDPTVSRRLDAIAFEPQHQLRRACHTPQPQNTSGRARASPSRPTTTLYRRTLTALAPVVTFELSEDTTPSSATSCCAAQSLHETRQTLHPCSSHDLRGLWRTSSPHTSLGRRKATLSEGSQPA